MNTLVKAALGAMALVLVFAAPGWGVTEVECSASDFTLALETPVTGGQYNYSVQDTTSCGVNVGDAIEFSNLFGVTGVSDSGTIGSAFSDYSSSPTTASFMNESGATVFLSSGDSGVLTIDAPNTVSGPVTWAYAADPTVNGPVGPAAVPRAGDIGSHPGWGWVAGTAVGDAEA